MNKFYLLALALVVGCASAGGGGTAQTGADRNVIMAEEISSVPSANLYDLIEKLRPNMLRSRGPSTFGGSATSEYPDVYLDGRRYGDVSSLRSIVSSQVSRVRYYSASDAAAKFGMINASGVIEVTSKQ